MCFSVSAWDRIHPMFLGLPFNLFWLVLWIVLTPLCMWGAYRVEMPRSRDAAPSVSAGTPRQPKKDDPSA